MPKMTEAHTEARKKQILDAAVARFARKGFHQTTMQNICAQAKLSPGAIYTYFKSKEDIIMSIAERNLQRNLALITGVTGQGGARETLDRLADVFFGMIDDPDLIPVRLDIELWGEALRNKKILRILRKSFDSHLRALADIIVIAQRNGEIDPTLDPESVSRAMMSQFEGLMLQKMICRNVDTWRYVDVVKKMVDGLFAHSPEAGKNHD